jgi:hypothetical protein
MQDDDRGGVAGGNAPPGDRAGPTRPKAGDPLAPSGRIGAQLRALYDEIEREPVPSDLLDLLERLDEAERRQSK